MRVIVLGRMRSPPTVNGSAWRCVCAWGPSWWTRGVVLSGVDFYAERGPEGNGDNLAQPDIVFVFMTDDGPVLYVANSRRVSVLGVWCSTRSSIARPVHMLVVYDLVSMHGAGAVQAVTTETLRPPYAAVRL